MLRLILFISIFLPMLGLCQHDLVLPGNEDGQWRIYANNQEVLLPETVHDLGNFDEKGLTYFAEFGKYGIINKEGDVVQIPIFKNVKQLGGGLYQCLQKEGLVIVDFSSVEREFEICLSAQLIQAKWYLIEKETSSYLYNRSTKKEIVLTERDTIRGSIFNYLYIDFFEGKKRLFSPTGDEIQIDEGSVSFYDGYLLLQAPGQKKVIYPSYEIALPSGASFIEVHEREIHYADNGNVFIVDSKEGNILFQANYDGLQRLNDHFFITRRDGKYGVIKEDHSVICPPKYEYIYRCNSNDGYYIRNNGLQGVMNANGVEVVACKYEWIGFSPDFYFTHGISGTEGLISRKTGKEILACFYDKIELKQGKIRAWSNNKMRLLTLDEDHGITEDLVLDNVITLINRRNSFLDKTGIIDKRLFSLGWFAENQPMFDSLGYKVGEQTKWGLHGINDTLLLKAKYSEPKYIPNAMFSLIPRSNAKYNYAGRRGLKRTAFSIVNHTTGKIVIPEPILTVDSMDLFKRDFTRFHGQKGAGIILSNGEIVRMNYLSNRNGSNIRYCNYESIEPAYENSRVGVRFPSMDFNKPTQYGVDFHFKKKNYKNALFKKAKWNYLTLNGDKLLEEDLDFANPFYLETAIVKKKGRWGVLRGDSLIIPARYSSIDRVSQYADTIFKVGINPRGKDFLDTLGQSISVPIQQFFKNKGAISQVLVKKEKVIINAEYEIISSDVRSPRLLDEHVFYEKRKSVYTLFGNKGEYLGAINMKPIAVFENRFVLTKSGSKYGILNMDGDTLIAFVYKSIEYLKDEFAAFNGVDTKLYSESGEVIKNFKGTRLLYDEVTGNYAAYDQSKVKILSKGLKGLTSVKEMQPILFDNGWLLQVGIESRLVHLDEREITFPFAVKEMEKIEGVGYVLVDSERESHLYDFNWEACHPDEQFKNLKYVGEKCFIGRSKDGVVLVSESMVKKFEKDVKNVGVFSRERLLLGKGGKYFYVNSLGENVFQREYVMAEPFMGGYASVKEPDGWTIIDQAGHAQLLPSFSRIEPVGSNLFSMNKQAIFGLIDGHGEIILEPIYQQVTILSEKLIQCVLHGEILYFDAEGEKIVL